MSSRRRVLVVDDLELNRQLLRIVLQARGYDVVEAHDGEDALTALAHGAIDLVLLDYRMPRMDGLELCRRIRAQPALRFLPIIMLTATDEALVRRAARMAGADDFLPKPFEVDELVARVARLLALATAYTTSVTEREAAEVLAHRWRLVSEVATAVGRCRDHGELLAAIVATLGPALAIDRASYYELAGDQPRLIAATGGGAGPDASAEEAIAAVVIGGRRHGAVVLGRARPFLATDRDTLDELAIHLGNAIASVRSQLAADQLEAARRELFALLVHDFRGPLTTMLDDVGRLAVARDPQVLGDLRAASDELLDLTLDLLDIGSAEDGRFVLAPVPADVAALVARAVAAQAARTGRAIDLELASDATAMVDPARLGRAVANLLTSTLRRSGALGRVEVVVARDRDDVVVRVTDDGPAVPAAARIGMFDKYAPHAGAAPRRSAVGLYLCRLVVQAHRGSLTVADRVGGGAIFEARLPIAPPA